MKNEKLKQRTFAKGFISPWSIFFACSIFIIPVLFNACEYNNKPGIIYDSSMVMDTTGKPTITGFTPAAGAFAGVREIQINGSNLGLINGTDTDWVFIGGVSPLIKEIHDSYITVYRPKLANDHYNIPISVSVTNAKMPTESFSASYYVESPGTITGDYSSSSTVTTALTATEFDKNENIYVMSVGKNLYKTDPAGVTRTTILNSQNLVPSEYASITTIAFGPGSKDKNLFIADGKSNIGRIDVYDTLNRTGTKSPSPVKLITPAPVSGLDFDENGNMYVAGNANLYIADTSVGNSAAPTFNTISGYAGVTNLIKIRIIKESGSQYIYYADSMHVWKSQISGSALVSITSLVDLSTHPELTGCKLSSFEVDINGSLFLCLKNHPKYSLFFRETDGSITPFYYDQNILPKTVEKIVWGYGKNLYLISGSLQTVPGTYDAGRIYRLVMDRYGAPYNGRKFIK